MVLLCIGSNKGTDRVAFSFLRGKGTHIVMRKLW
jgi:hypothetical protein